MQLVSKDILKKLAGKKDGIVEDENSASEFSFSYSEFLEEYNKALKMQKDKGISYNDEIAERAFKFLIGTYFQDKCPPISYVGSGSSRVAFAVDGGKCLKVAKNYKGIAQNKQEVKNSDMSKYSCFAHTYDFDSKTYGSLLTECCSINPRHEFADFYGIENFSVFEEALDDIVNSWNCDIQKAGKNAKSDLDELNTSINSGYENRREYYVKSQLERFNFILNLKRHFNSSQPQWKVMHDLIQFYIDHGKNDSSMLVGDIAEPDNWGLAVRDGVIVPVVIDAGFSLDVSEKYY